MRRASCSSYCVALSMARKLLKDANGLLYARNWRVPPRTRRGHSAFRGGAFVDSYLRELYGHQEWADAEHWRAFESHPAALADKAIRERLLHIHLVQHAFLWLLGTRNQQFEVKEDRRFREPARFEEIWPRRAHANECLSERPRPAARRND